MVRECRPSDLQAVVSLFERSVHEVASHDYSPAQISAWAPEHPNQAARARRLETGGVFAYERNDEILGFARIDFTGCLDLLFVHPEFQRQGVTRVLLDRVISWALSQDMCYLRSEVSVTARPFFESVGFRVVREQIVQRRGVSLQNFVMEKTLTPNDRVEKDAADRASHPNVAVSITVPGFAWTKRKRVVTGCFVFVG